MPTQNTQTFNDAHEGDDRKSIAYQSAVFIDISTPKIIAWASGALIAPNLVLTAGHTFDGNIGLHNCMIIHPATGQKSFLAAAERTTSKDGDLGLIQLQTTIEAPYAQIGNFEDATREVCFADLSIPRDPDTYRKTPWPENFLDRKKALMELPPNVKDTKQHKGRGEEGLDREFFFREQGYLADRGNSGSAVFCKDTGKIVSVTAKGRFELFYPLGPNGIRTYRAEEFYGPSTQTLRDFVRSTLPKFKMQPSTVDFGIDLS